MYKLIGLQTVALFCHENV